MKDKILLATTNVHKQEKLRWIVEKFFLRVETPEKHVVVEETGKSFEEIACNKALAYGKNYSGFTIATDGGMEIPVLGNSWSSVMTRRFKNGTDFERMDALLELMKDKTDRRMRWREAVAIAYKGRIVFSTTVEGARGVLQTSYDKAKYKEGIWLCSLWYFPTYKKNFFDLKPRQTNFAEVSWFRLRDKVGRFFSISFNIRTEQYTCLSKVSLVPGFTLKNWPHDTLMETIKEQVTPILNETLEKNDFLLDEKDLKYQVLFRLTTYKISELFNDKLEEYLTRSGVYSNWRNLLDLDRSYVRKFTINKDLVERVIHEQKEVIKLRMERSKLPLALILDPKNKVFRTKGWLIEKSLGKIYASDNKTRIELTFRKINKIYAKKLHKDLHYIHHDRVDEAFGLFIKGEEIPFSVLGVEKIDRDYKKNALLIRGYNYNKVVDFTRLYSFPNSPMNTSSVMFSLTRNYYRKNSDVQATLSAFMPSYANGMSMFAGGMDEVLIAKPLKHLFIKLENTDLYYHAVKKALGKYTGRIIASKIPLLPTLELLSKITKPPLEPLEEIHGKMVDLT